jgi:hypothetical protein
MTATYEKIATTTLGSNQASVTFSGISGSYTDLVLVCNYAVNTANRNSYIQFNSDTGTNYSITQMLGNGSTASSVRYSNQSKIFLTDSAMSTSTNGNAVLVNIQNYSNSTTYKTCLIRQNRADSYVEAIAGLWRSTSAITTVLISSEGANLLSGSTFTLYGIKAE